MNVLMIFHNTFGDVSCMSINILKHKLTFRIFVSLSHLLLEKALTLNQLKSTGCLF